MLSRTPKVGLDADKLEFVALLPVATASDQAPETFRYAKQGVAVKVISGDKSVAVSGGPPGASIEGQSVMWTRYAGRRNGGYRRKKVASG